MSKLFLTFALSLVAAGAALALQDSDVADEREEIAALLDELKGHIKDKKGGGDEQAIGVIDRLLQEFPDSGPKDREAIVESMEDCLKVRRRTELEPGVPDDRLFMASAVALATMGPESVKPLIGQIGHKNHRDNVRLQRMLILSLGKTRDVAGVKTLRGLLKHKDAELQAAAAEALGEFVEAEQDLRKDVFEDLLKLLMSQKAAIDANQADDIARDRWNLIAGPILSTLRALTGHDERVPEEWQRWWNKNKKADWDDLG